MSLQTCLVAALLLLSCSIVTADAPSNEAELLAKAKNDLAKVTAERDDAQKKLVDATKAAADAAAEASKAAAAAEATKKTVEQFQLKIKQLEADLAKEVATSTQLKTSLEKEVANSKELTANLAKADSAESSLASCEQQTQHLKAEISSLSESQAAARKQYEEAVDAEARLRTELDGNRAKILELEQKLRQADQSISEAAHKAGQHEHLSSTCQQQKTGAEAQLKQLQAQLEVTKSQLAKAEAAAASGGELEELLKYAQDSWLPLWMQYRAMKAQEFLVQLMEDLKAGKHGPHGIKLYNFVDVAHQHATKVYDAGKPHVEKGYATAKHHAGKAYDAARPHLEDGVSKATVVLEKVLTTVSAAWTKYVSDAEWMREAKAQISKVEADLVREVSQRMQDVPALQPYSDPVTVQLLVYGIITVPLLLFLVPLLAVCCARPASSGKESHKRKPDKSRPSSTKRHKKA